MTAQIPLSLYVECFSLESLKKFLLFLLNTKVVEQKSEGSTEICATVCQSARISREHSQIADLDQLLSTVYTSCMVASHLVLQR